MVGENVSLKLQDLLLEEFRDLLLHQLALLVKHRELGVVACLDHMSVEEDLLFTHLNLDIIHVDFDRFVTTFFLLFFRRFQHFRVDLERVNEFTELFVVLFLQLLELETVLELLRV